MPKTTAKPKQIESLRHDEARRPYIPTAEYEAVVDDLSLIHISEPTRPY